MIKYFTPQKAKTFLTAAFTLAMLLCIQNTKAQPLAGTYAGAAAWTNAANYQGNLCIASTAPGTLPTTAIACGGTSNGQNPMGGSGTYTYLPTTNWAVGGKNLQFSLVGTTFDSELGLWYNDGTNNWQALAYNDDAGPGGAGDDGSFNVNMPANSTGGNYILVVNKFNQAQWAGTQGSPANTTAPTSYGSSSILTYRENGLPTLTASATAVSCGATGTGTASLSMGGTCQTHTITNGSYDEFNKGGVAISDAYYSGRWTKNANGSGNVDVTGQAYFNGTGAWNTTFKSVASVTPAEGLTFQGRIYNTGTDVMVGWRNANASDNANNYIDFVHALYFYPSGGVQLYEDGAQRTLPYVGGVDLGPKIRTFTGLGSLINVWLEFKIVLKAATTAYNGGCVYYIRKYVSGADTDPWLPVFTSTYNSVTTTNSLKAGMALNGAATVYLDDLFMGGATQYPALTALAPGAVKFGAQDQFGNVATGSCTIGAEAVVPTSITAPANITVTTTPANACAGAGVFANPAVTDACTGEGKGGINVLPLSSNLKLWVKADAGVELDNTGRVLNWRDLSGNNNDLIQAGITSRPTLTASSTSFNANPCVTFNTTQWLKGVSSLDAGATTNYTMFTISRLTGTNQRLISSASTNWLFGYHNVGPCDKLYCNNWISSSTASYADALPHMYEMSSSGATASQTFLYENGILLATGTAGAINGPGRLELNGYNSDAGAPSEMSTGEVAEVIYYNTVLTAAQRQIVEGYLAYKYNLPAPLAAVQSFQAYAAGATRNFIGSDQSGNTVTTTATSSVSAYAGPTVTPSVTTTCTTGSIDLPLTGMAPAGKYLNCPASADYFTYASGIPVGSTWTIETWAKFPLPNNGSGGWNTLVRGANHHIIVSRQGAATTSPQILGVYNGGFYPCSQANTINTYKGFDLSTLSAGWHHIAAVASGGTTTFYVDGMFVGISNSACTDNIIAIGNYQGGGQPFGALDEFKIWNTALSQTTINDNMTKARATGTANLVAYYKFDGTNVDDATVSHTYNGTLAGAATTSTITGYYTYNWGQGGGGSPTWSNTTSTTLETNTVSTLAVGSYNISVTATANSCSSQTVVTAIKVAPAAAVTGPIYKCGSLGAFALTGNDPTVGATIAGVTGAWTVITVPSGSSVVANTTYFGSLSTYNTNFGAVDKYGQYKLRWTVTGGTCSTTADLIINYQEAADAGGATPIYKCGSKVTVLAGVAPSVGSGTWTQSGGTGTSGFTLAGASSNNATATATLYGAKTYMWTTTNTGCSSSATVSVNFQEAADAGGATPIYKCGTLAAVLAGVAPSVGTGTWTQSAGTGTSGFTLAGASSNNATATATLYGAKTYMWTTTNTGCSSSATVSVNFQETATAGTSPQNVTCNATTSTSLGANTPSTSTSTVWSYSGPGIVTAWTPNINTSTATATVSAYGSYSFKWTTTNGTCSTTADIVVNYSAQNTITASSNPVCDFPLSNTYAYTNNPTTSSWSLLSGGGTFTTSGNTFTYDPVNVPSGTTYVDAVIRATNGTCLYDYTARIYNKPTITTLTTSMCEGAQRTLTTDLAAVDISWDVVGSNCPTCITGVNTDLFTAPNPGGGSATYTFTAYNNVCSTSFGFQVDQGLTIVHPTATCETTAATFTSTPAAYFSVFSGTGSMSTGSGSLVLSSDFSNPSTLTPPAQFINSTVRIKSQNLACIYDFTIRTDNQNSIVSPTANPSPVCDNTTMALDGDVDGVVWASSIGSFGGTSPGQDPTFTPTALTTGTSATGTITATNGLCAVQTLNIRVDRNPSISGFNVTPPTPACELVDFTPSSNINVTWSSSATGIATVTAGPATSTTVHPLAITSTSTLNLPVNIVATNGQCVVTKAVQVDNKPVFISNPTSPACETTSPDFTADLGDANVVWTTSHGSITNTGINRGVLTYNVPNGTSSQVVTVTATNGSCVTNQNITIDNQPDAPTVGTNQVLCGGALTTTLSGSTPTSGVGTWSQFSGSGTTNYTLTNNHTPSATATASVTGTYVYKWQIDNGVCVSNSTNLTVVYDPIFSSTPVVDECLNYDYLTTDLNYYVLLSASGGTTPYSFPGNVSGLYTQVGSVSAATKIYEQVGGTSGSYAIFDAVGCPASGNGTTLSPPGTPPGDIAASTWTGPGTTSATVNCYDVGFNRWVTYRNGANDAILSINAQNNNLGLVTASVYRNDNEPVVLNSSWGNGNCYQVPMRPMERHFVVTTTNTLASGSGNHIAKVRLYFTATELSDLVTETTGAANWDIYCSHNDDVNNIGELYVTKYTAPTGQLATEDGDYSNNIPANSTTYPGAIYRLFGNGVTVAGNGPLTRSTGGFATLFTSGNAHNYVQMDVAEFSEFWLHGSRHIEALPVQMIYLEANPINNAYIQVKWGTAIEVNNNGFNVERSIDGQTWATIGFVNGHNNATTQNDYSFDDMNVTANVVYYYRLKQVDNDGAFQYTDIVSAQISGDISFSVKDFVPNPTADKTNLIITATRDQEITVTFYNVVGQKVIESNHQLNKGGNMLTFELGTLASGTYTAVVSSANAVYTKKLVLTR